MDQNILSQALAALMRTVGQTVERGANAVAEYGPDALMIAGRYLQIQAIAQIAIGLILFVGFCIAARIFRKNFAESGETEEEAQAARITYKSGPTARQAKAVICTIISGMVGVIMFIGACANTLDSRNWASAADYRLALVAYGLDALQSRSNRR